MDRRMVAGNAPGTPLKNQFIPVLVVLLYSMVAESIVVLFPASRILKYSDELLCVVLMLFVLLHYWRLPRLPFLFLVLFVVCGIVSTLVRGDSLTISAQGMLLAVKGPLLFLSAALMPVDEQDFSRLGEIMTVVFYFLTACSLVDLALGESFKQVFQSHSEYRFGILSLTSIYRFPTDLAYASFLYAMFFINNPVRKRPVLGFLAIVQGILAFRIKEIFAFIACWLVRKKALKFRYVALLLMVGTILFMVYALVFPEHYERYFGEKAIESTARTVLYVTAVKISLDNAPLGVGFGRFGGEISARNYSPVYGQYGIDSVYGLSREYPAFIKDTFWPMILGETGFAGLVCYVAMLVSMFSHLYAERTSGNASRFSEFLRESARFVFLFTLIGSVAQPSFFRPPAYILVFFFGGLVYSFTRKESRELRPDTLSASAEKHMASTGADCPGATMP